MARTATITTEPALLSVRQLSLGLPAGPVVQGLSFDVHEGETFALIGESGCGKSLTALALMRLLPPAVRWAGGMVSLAGVRLDTLPEAEMRRRRGGGMGMIFQEPGASLNPVMPVGQQIGEALAIHRGLTGPEARAEVARLLQAVGVGDVPARLDAYPFQLSGGLKQRVMIALALAASPRVLIADEPTTALDVTVQAQVLALLARLQRERRMGMLLITHDLGVVARMADRVGVMYGGELVEVAPCAAFFAQPHHPYSKKLFAALPGQGRRLVNLPGRVPLPGEQQTGCRFAPRCDQAVPPCQTQVPPWVRVGQAEVRCHAMTGALRADRGLTELPAPSPAPLSLPPVAPAAVPLFEVCGLSVRFPVQRGWLRRPKAWLNAVDEVSLSLEAGQTLALVGESGCGKSTLGRAILHLIEPSAGRFLLDGQPVDLVSRAGRKAFRRQVQMVFQDPYASLNARMTVGEILLEGMTALDVGDSLAARQARVAELLEQVGLDPAMAGRHPHQFSGGQRQRIAIARVLAVSPRLVVCDEPTSALDVSVQAQILNLLVSLQARYRLAYLFITHNIAVVAHLADRLAVMYLGRIVEEGPAARVLGDPAHPYTRTLLAAVLPAEPARHRAATDVAAPLAVEAPSATLPPSGCAFHPRCPAALPVCRATRPGATRLGDGRRVCCHLFGEG